MNGFRVECQQLGTAGTETVARPGECRRIGHATKLHSLKSHNTHEDPGFGGPIPVTVGTFETKVRKYDPYEDFGLYHWGVGGRGDTMGGGVPTRDTRPYIYIYIYIYISLSLSLSLSFSLPPSVRLCLSAGFCEASDSWLPRGPLALSSGMSKNE